MRSPWSRVAWECSPNRVRQTGGPSKSCGGRIQSSDGDVRPERPEWFTSVTAPASRFLVVRRICFPSEGRRNRLGNGLKVG
ncbi:hypothetical protein CDAR_502381 [Caerostris darwini]|uniref:Uncharacterized protein n=1 Tax=Caerostris darwini TaxID=1538125 RepID=A0AAV4MNJ0_9ARAC|nr:hypothetical protein CDAR_446781 [Caerostris darwini]GIY43166.1 hypothetical protein CDAR_502381 [Caerostris darwini]